MESKPDAVVIRDACKKYGRGKKAHSVLNRLSLDVKSGQIYALLGASGCGKTTLLTCMLGIRKLDSGQIRILGQHPDGVRVVGGRVGYMPQEMSLYMEFSAREIMALFGRLHGMGRKDVRDRMDFLSRFLKLPDLDRPTHSLSGGQQRRVSFAIALFHQPDMLILDEPTVGVDTILRQAIWNHLGELASSGTTIILTTHYIGEASRADVVGFMRNGRLLAQNTPKDLLTKHSLTRLEDVFLVLSSAQENTVLPEPIVQESVEVKTPPSDGAKRPGTFRNHVAAILYRNLHRVYHYIPLSSICLISPVIVMALYCIVLGGSLKGLPLGVVNNEWPTDPICLPYDDCLLVNLSCRFLNQMDGDIIQLQPYGDEESALQAVMEGQAWGYLYFPRNYSDCVAERMLDMTLSDNGTLNNAVATLKMDMTSKPLSLTVQRTLLLGYENFSKELLSMCGVNPNLMKYPLQFESSLSEVETPTFQHFTLPGMLASIVLAFPVNTVLCFVTMERSEGMLTRIWVAGVTDAELLVSELVTQSVFLVTQFMPVVPLMYWYLGLTVTHNLPWFVLLLLLEGTSSVALGFLVSVLVPTLADGGAISLVIGLTLWFASGTIWPLESITMIGLKEVCWANPVTRFAEAYRDVLVRGRGIGHPRVILAFLYGTGWTLAFMLAAAVAFRRLKFKFVR